MKKWKAKERRDQKDFKAEPIRGSGNQWNRPGDQRNETFLIDSKSTTHKSFTITLEMWNKLCEEAAFSGGRIPMLSLEIQKLELVVLQKSDLLHLLKELQAQEHKVKP